MYTDWKEVFLDQMSKKQLLQGECVNVTYTRSQRLTLAYGVCLHVKRSNGKSASWLARDLYWIYFPNPVSKIGLCYNHQPHTTITLTGSMAPLITMISFSSPSDAILLAVKPVEVVVVCGWWLWYKPILLAVFGKWVRISRSAWQGHTS